MDLPLHLGLEQPRQNPLAADQSGVNTLPQSKPRFAQQVEQCPRPRALGCFESQYVIAVAGMEPIEMHQRVLQRFVLIQNRCEPTGTQLPADDCGPDLLVDAQGFLKMPSG